MGFLKTMFEESWSAFDVFILLNVIGIFDNKPWWVVGTMIIYFVLKQVVKTSIRIYKRK